MIKHNLFKWWILQHLFNKVFYNLSVIKLLYECITVIFIMTILYWRKLAYYILRISSHVVNITNSVNILNEEIQKTSLSLQLQLIQCIFYVNDDCLFMKKYLQHFTHLFKMMNYVKKIHLHYIKMSEFIHCFHLCCNDLVFKNISYFKNHC